MVYQGSKARIAKDICPIIQKAIDESNCDTFIDAFVGGANLIQHIKCKDKFWDRVRELSKNNKVFISELSAPEDFKMIWHKKIKNTVGLNNSLEQVEKLFVKE